MRFRRLAIATALVCLGGSATGVTVGCNSRGEDGGRSGERRVTELAQPGPELSRDLMLGLALARNLHHKADVYLKEARVAEAVAAVRQILNIQFPPGSPEGEDVQQDARARLAKLLVPQGKLEDALEIVNEGIARARRDSFFLANLYSVRGEVLEARAARVLDSDKAAATAAWRQAIESYDRAIAIEKALIDQLAGGEEGE